MYYVNKEQIDRRLSFMGVVMDTSARLSDHPQPDNPIIRFAAERAVHLAAECVTDIGSYLIDGFVMRDAGSYEDIVDILHDEKVFSDDIYPFLQSLVRWRKPLVQEFDRINGQQLLQLAGQLPAKLARFAEAVRAYLEKELG